MYWSTSALTGLKNWSSHVVALRDQEVHGNIVNDNVQLHILEPEDGTR